MQSRPCRQDWQELLWSFAKHRVLTCASRTGLLEVISGCFIDPDTAARELRLEPVAVAKTLRALAELGVAERDGDGRFRLASGFVAVFGSGKEAAPFLDHSHHLYDSWGENLESFLRGGPWARFSRDAEGIRRFSEAMRSMARVVGPEVAEALDLVGVRRVIDFGGGVGEYARVLCRASADIHVTVVETPTVAAFGTAELESEFRGRIEFLGGDYIEADCGAGYDLALLVNVVHQENEERASRLISQAAKVLSPGGRLAIVDFALSEDGGSELGALFSLNMRGFGDVYDARRLSHWMRGASLSHLQKTCLGPHRMMLVGHKLPKRSVD